MRSLRKKLLRRNPTDIERARAGDKNLRGANLADLHIRPPFSFAGADFTGANLENAILLKLDFAGANFEGANLKGALIFSSDLTGANLRNTKLRGASLNNVRADGVDFSGSEIHRTQFAGAKLRGASFAGADISEANFGGAALDGTVFTGAKVKDPYLKDANVQDAIGFRIAYQHTRKVKSPSSLRFKEWFGNSVLRDASGEPMVLYHGSGAGGFTEFSLKKIDAWHPGFFLADDLSLAQSYTRGKTLDPFGKRKGSGVYRVFVKMERPYVVDAKGASWKQIPWPTENDKAKTDMIGNWAKKNGYDGAIIHNVRDEGPSGGFADPATVYIVFDPRNIKSAAYNSGMYDPLDPDIRHNPRLRRNPSVEVRKVGAKFCVFMDGKDTGKWAASEEKAQALRARMGVPAPAAAPVKAATAPKARTAAATPQTDKDFRNANLSGRKLKGKDFSQANLQGASLDGSVLDESNFSGANMRKVTGMGFSLRNANLTGADLTGASLVESDLRGVRLDGAILDGTDFSDSDLRGAYVRGAKGQNTDFTGVHLGKADFTGSSLPQSQYLAADLSDTEFAGADLTGANFYDANIKKAKLAGANLTRASGLSKPVKVAAVKYPTTDAFKKWFGKSVVVDKKGKPIVLYHGSTNAGFTAFDLTKVDPQHPGFFFADTPELAATYSGDEQLDPFAVNKPRGIYRAFVKMERPLVIDGQGKIWDQVLFQGKKTSTNLLGKYARANGYDGVIVRNIEDFGPLASGSFDDPGDVYIVFDPKNIKSAAYNLGTWDPNDADIRHNPKRPKRLR